MRRFLTSLIVAACFGPVQLQAQVKGDPTSGRQIAQTWCTSCHALSAASTNDIAPSFPAIAQNSAKTEDQLRTWLMRPHAPMPDYSLSRDDINDIIAFLQTLEK